MKVQIKYKVIHTNPHNSNNFYSLKLKIHSNSKYTIISKKIAQIKINNKSSNNYP